MDYQSLRVLLVDAEDDTRQSLAAFLGEEYNFITHTAAGYSQAWNRVTQVDQPHHVVLIDIALPNETLDKSSDMVPAITLMQRIKARSPQTGFILFRHPEVKVSLADALGAGAFRYLEKSFPPHELAVLIRYAAEERERSILEHLFRTRTDSIELQNEEDALTSLLHGIQQLHFDRVRIYTLSDDKAYMVGRVHVGMGPDFIGMKRPIAGDMYLQHLLYDSQREH
ncbi:MAG: hypothetical protein ETSY2_52100, partial [Candidatus Entotheonella gemina]